jgi:branched-chain amino acid transport system permease protein
MRKTRHFYVYGGLSLAFLIGLIGLPLAVGNRYLIHILIVTGMYTALALGYDLIVGHVGLLSLAHPTFFGLGAYVAAIGSTRFGTPFLADFVLAGIVAAGLAFLISKPFFRLAGVSFAIGTLGFALIMQLVANNELWLTRGPMCIYGIPPARLTLPPLLDWHVSSVTDYYYLMLGIVVVVVALCSRLTTSRLGRTFMSLREDEILAMASGVNPLKYKTFAFVIGALIAGSVGAYYAHYSRLACPSQLSNYMTTILLIIVFLGGVGRMRGVILGAIIFTFVPEFLRIAYTLRMVIYGALLLFAIVYMPEGLDGRLTEWLRKSRFSGTGATSGEQEQG